MRRNLVGRTCGKIDAACQVLACHRLLIDGTGDRDGGRFQFLDLTGDRTQGADTRSGGLLHGTDLLGDFLGRAARLGGQFFHFAGNDREAAAGLPAACSLDRGIQREKVRPLRDRLDKLDDLSDLFGRRGQS